MTLRTFKLWAAAALWLTFVAPASAQDFYKGKSIRLIVGASAGGGYDTYSRTIARHMGKHIPGNPVFVVENMPGAGFLISANYMYRIAKPDGLTIGHFSGGLFLQQLLGNPASSSNPISLNSSACRRKTAPCSEFPERLVSQLLTNGWHLRRQSH